jgi:hypothetical protein
MTASALAAAVVSLALIPAISPAPDSTLSRVRIRVTDMYGNVLRDARINLSGPGGTIDGTAKNVLEVKPGVYHLEVALAGFDTLRTTVTVDERQQLLTVGMHLGAYEGLQHPCSVSGVTDPAKNITRVRLMPLFGAELRDVPISRDGSFRFDALECGSYMLMAIDSVKLVAWSCVTVSKQETHVRLKMKTHL